MIIVDFKSHSLLSLSAIMLPAPDADGEFTTEADDALGFRLGLPDVATIPDSGDWLVLSQGILVGKLSLNLANNLPI